MRVLLGSLHHCALLLLVPPHVDLLDAPTTREHRRLSLQFIGDGVAHRAQAVEVLDFDLGAVLAPRLLLVRADADVGFAAQRALLHVAAVDPDRPQRGAQLGQVGIRFLGAVDIRFGHDLHQRRAGTVEVDVRIAPLVDRAAGVLFQVDAPDADLFGRPILQVDLQEAVGAERELILADLVALGQVRVGVVLTGKDRCLGDRAVERQPCLDRRLHRRPVDHRQGARHPQANRAHPCIGRRSLVVRRAAAEHLRLCQRLGMHLHAHHQLKLPHIRFRSKHRTTTSRRSDRGAHLQEVPTSRRSRLFCRRRLTHALVGTGALG